MGKLFEEHTCAQADYEERQRALEALQATCVRENVCATCGASAGLYLAASAAESAGLDRERFLALAADIWADMQRQDAAAPAH